MVRHSNCLACALMEITSLPLSPPRVSSLDVFGKFLTPNTKKLQVNTPYRYINAKWFLNLHCDFIALSKKHCPRCAITYFKCNHLQQTQRLILRNYAFENASSPAVTLFLLLPYFQSLHETRRQIRTSDFFYLHTFYGLVTQKLLKQVGQYNSHPTSIYKRMSAIVVPIFFLQHVYFSFSRTVPLHSPGNSSNLKCAPNPGFNKYN